MSITNKILIGMGLGLFLGSLLNTFASQVEFIQAYLVTGLFHVIGSAFINSLKMLVVPLVTFSLICGVCGIGDIGALGRSGNQSVLALFDDDGNGDYFGTVRSYCLRTRSRQRGIVSRDERFHP